MNYSLIVKGNAFYTSSRSQLEFLADSLFFIDFEGKIVNISQPSDKEYSQQFALAKQQKVFVELKKGQYLIPGLVDLHIHAPQWPQAGRALDKPLEDWLQTYTFPLEARFSDLDYATTVYENLVSHLLANGTTTGLYFASIHREASFRLAEICAKKGQRGLVGKVVMDDPIMNPDFYRDASTESALADTESFIQNVQALHKTTKQGVYPVVTPRFIPSCTDEALHGLGKLAKKYDVHIQSHCSESDWEHHYVKERFNQNDAHALHSFQLLGDKAVMAHCNHLAHEDALLFQQTGTGIAHCPISNAYFANAVLPIAEFANDYHLDIGLGTDISGGFSPSLFENIRQAVMASRYLDEGVDPKKTAAERGAKESKISMIQAFYHATAGGGQALSLPIGKFEKNYAWDALVIDTQDVGNPMPFFESNIAPEEILESMLYLIQATNIQKVWVQGELVHQKGV